MPKVKYSGPWAESSGYASANRNIITALHESGVDVSTELQVYANQKTDYGEQFEICKSLQNKDNGYKIKVLHITPNVYAKHKEVGKYHVGHLFWETDGMTPEWAWYLREVDEIWTGCEWNKQTFLNAGFKGPVHIYPQPIDTVTRGQKKSIHGARGYIFYSIFQWIERKDPKTLLQAYWREFENEQNVTMILKTYGLSFSKQETKKLYEQISRWKTELNLSNYPRVLVIDYLLSRQDILNLHASGDCFVASHRGEGWGIPEVEAMVHAKPVIATGLGGVMERVPDKFMYKVRYDMVPVSGMDWAEQYAPDQNWGQADINDLRAKMRYVFENQEDARRVGEWGQKFVRDNYNYKRVGELMKNRLNELEDELC